MSGKYKVFKATTTVGRESIDTYEMGLRCDNKKMVAKDLTFDEALGMRVFLNSQVPEYVKFIGLDAIRNLMSCNQEKEMNQPYVIVRSAIAGVIAGEMVERVGQEVQLKDARKIWYWEGAATLAQLAEEGVKKPDGCKFPQMVSRIDVLDVSEVLYCTPEGRASIEAVPVWKIK